MTAKPAAAFLDFASVGPEVDTAPLDRLVAATYYPRTRPEEIRERLADVEIVIVNKVKLSREEIGAANRLRLIVLAATGTDNVDCAAAQERSVAVANIRDYCSAAVAQHVFALILGLTHHVAAYDRLARSGTWQRSECFALFDYPIRELAGRTLGIVGFGSLGRAVASLGRCFGMELIVAARPGGDAEEGDVAGTHAAHGEGERLPLHAVLDRSHVLSLHCPLTPATHHLIGRDELGRMRPDALLINTARGGLVDGRALVEALRAGEIAGAGIDVLPTEPPPADEPLLAQDIPNLLLTPHIAWAAREARQRGLEQVADNIEAFLAGASLRRVV
jgi:glycerate dehydrogenase